MVGHGSGPRKRAWQPARRASRGGTARQNAMDWREAFAAITAGTNTLNEPAAAFRKLLARNCGNSESRKARKVLHFAGNLGAADQRNGHV
jgi:hypothetical protein